MAELQELNLDSTTLVWREGFEVWMALKEIEELSDLIRKSPPPIPTKKKEPSNHNVTIKKEKKEGSRLEIKKYFAKSIMTQIKYIKHSFLWAILLFLLCFFVIENYFEYSSPVDESEFSYIGIDHKNEWGKYRDFIPYYDPDRYSSKQEMIDKIEHEIKDRKQRVISYSFMYYGAGIFYFWLSMNIIGFFRNASRWTKKHSQSYK